jgi:hypothetical protein
VSFRRYVGKYVEVSVKDAGGQPLVYVAKLFEYEQSGIWLHYSKDVVVVGGQARNFEGYLFIPHEQIISVFGCDDLDTAVEDAAEQETGA